MGKDTEEERFNEIELHRQVARAIASGDVEASRAGMMRILNIPPGSLLRLVAPTR